MSIVTKLKMLRVIYLYKDTKCYINILLMKKNIFTLIGAF